MTQPRMRISATVLGAPEPRSLGNFYARLLGWDVVSSDATWVMVRPLAGGSGLSFQLEPHFVRPVWPAVPDKLQMASHLDIAVEELQAGVDWAPEAGATIADVQPQEDVRVMLDPVGHRFCLFAGEV